MRSLNYLIKSWGTPTENRESYLMLLVYGWFLVANALSNKTWRIRKFENDLDSIWNDGNARENEKWENTKRF